MLILVFLITLPFFIAFMIVYSIRRYAAKPSTVTSFNKTMITYDYYKKNGMIATILTVFFGSFGMLFASFKMAVFFFFFNVVIYTIVFSNTVAVSNPPPYEFLLPIARLVNVLAMIWYTNIRLKKAEKQFVAYVDEDLYRKQIETYHEADKLLPKDERKGLQMERYEKAKVELYAAWKGKA